MDLDATSIDDGVSEIRAWLATIEGETLNVAGPRASKDGEIYEKTREIVMAVLSISRGPR